MEQSGSAAAAEGLQAWLSHSLDLFPAADCIKKVYAYKKGGRRAEGGSGQV